MLAFAIRGVFRGTVWQVFALCGLLAGLWLAIWVSRWVGAHWLGARPAAVFLVLRWVVAGLAGLAVMSLLTWWGGLLSSAILKSPIGWLDRAGGVLMGASIGAAVASLLLTLVLLSPWLQGAAGWVARARISQPMLQVSSRAMRWGAPALPGGEWLKIRVEAAARRARTTARPS